MGSSLEPDADLIRAILDKLQQLHQPPSSPAPPSAATKEQAEKGQVQVELDGGVVIDGS